MADAIAAVPYAATVKVGLQFKRRFWEEDDDIYGGITATDLPINNISYPSNDFNNGGKGVLLGGYLWGLNAYEFTAMAPDERIRRTVEYGAKSTRNTKPNSITASPSHGIVAFHPGLLRGLVGRSSRQALRQPLPDRWSHRIGRRTRLLFACMAGRCGDISVGCH